MKLTVKDVEQVAELAKLELTNEEGQSFTQSLNEMIEYMETLKQVDTSKVEPTIYVLPLQNVFRKDELGSCLTREQVLVNTSEEENGCFKVPRII
jgi:aspartyl-tRNA(Asn)/glutamyl-tRNA(Gln) amidotransferase subunit C